MDAAEIRQKAIDLLQQNHPLEDLTRNKDLSKIVEELQVHQIELELQNEELRRTQQDLELARRKYLDLYNFAPVGYFTFDPNGVILELNLTAAKLFNMPRRRLVGRTLTPYLTHDSIITFYRHCQLVLTPAGENLRPTCELMLKNVDESATYVQLESVPVADEYGEYKQIHTAIVNITKRKLAEVQLKISEENWAALVNNTNDLIWAIDTGHNIIRSNNAMKDRVFREIGFRVNPGKSIFVITPPELNDDWRRFYSRAFRGEQFTVEVAFWNTTFEVAFNPIGSIDDGITGVVVYARDVSVRKEMEDALRQRNRELDAFAHTVSHNLQDPLSLIAGYADYIVKHSQVADPDEQAKVGAKLKEAAVRASTILDELLFLADVRQQKVRPEPVDMLALITEVVNRLKLLLEETGGAINLPPSFIDALGYAPWLEKVWLNILSASLRYSEDSSHISVDSEVEGRDQVRFWVQIDGSALPVGILEVLQNDFSRPAESAAGDHGLELSIVRQIVERLGGRVGAKATAATSYQIFFVLPAA